MKAEKISPEEPLDESQEEGLAEAPSEDLPPDESLSEPPPVQTISSMEQDQPRDDYSPEERGDLLPEEPSTEPPPVQVMSSMEQDLPPEKSSPEEPGDEPPDEPPASPPKKRPLPVMRTKLILLVFLISLGLYAYFVYPTIYENRTMKSGDTTYPVKINRLTKSMQYYDMGTWHNGPILKTSTYRARLTIPSDARSVPTEDKTLKAAEETPVKVPETTPVPTVERSSEKKGDTAIGEAEKKVEKPEEVAIVKATLPPGETIAKPDSQYIYAIQISSMRLKKLAEDFLEEFKRKGLDVYMRVIESENNGVWYAIYIGHFAGREDAVTYMKEKKITDSYPGSYIRKLPNR